MIAAAAAIAITIDDIPVHGPLPPGMTHAAVVRGIARALGRTPATGFVNGAQIASADGRAAMQAWRGRTIASHGFLHLDLDGVGSERFIADIRQNEAALATWSPDGEWRRFRFPYLREGKDAKDRAAVRGWLAAHAYRIAPATMNFNDWMWTAPYARCAARRDTRMIGWMERSYLAAAMREVARVGRGDQVLLLHAGAFTARMLPRLLGYYRREGFRLVPLSTIDPPSRSRGAVEPTVVKQLEGACREPVSTARPVRRSDTPPRRAASRG